MINKAAAVQTHGPVAELKYSKFENWAIRNETHGGLTGFHNRRHSGGQRCSEAVLINSALRLTNSMENPSVVF